MRARMLHMTDPYLRERMSDFDDLANRLLRQLMGRGPDAVARSLPKDAIVVARSMGAAELLDYPRDQLRGLVLEDGAPTSHVVIVARALGIPVVGQVKGAVSMSENGDAIIVDGETARVHLRPQSRRRDRLCREGALPGATAGALPLPARQAVAHQGRRRHRRC